MGVFYRTVQPSQSVQGGVAAYPWPLDAFATVASLGAMPSCALPALMLNALRKLDREDLAILTTGK